MYSENIYVSLNLKLNKCFVCSVLPQMLPFSFKLKKKKSVSNGEQRSLFLIAQFQGSVKDKIPGLALPC